MDKCEPAASNFNRHSWVCKKQYLIRIQLISKVRLNLLVNAAIKNLEFPVCRFHGTARPSPAGLLKGRQHSDQHRGIFICFVFIPFITLLKN